MYARDTLFVASDSTPERTLSSRTCSDSPFILTSQRPLPTASEARVQRARAGIYLRQRVAVLRPQLAVVRPQRIRVTPFATNELEVLLEGCPGHDVLDEVRAVEARGSELEEKMEDKRACTSQGNWCGRCPSAR